MKTKIVVSEKLEAGEIFKGKYVAWEDGKLRFLTEDGIEEIPVEWLKDDDYFDFTKKLKIGTEYYIYECFTDKESSYLIAIYPLDSDYAVVEARRGR
jgi:hypothetical protein